MRNIVEVIKSFSNLPKEYKLVLIRAFNTLFEAIAELDDIKVDKEEGKGLSENDFTDELKEKLDNIEPGATVQVPSDWEATSGVERILNKPDLRVYPDSAEWDKTTKKIYFKHQGTVLNPFTIDGTDFIKDGMINEVKIENDKLIIIFNTDSGKEAIEIPLSEIFNPDNYYTKNKTDELFVKKVEGKDLSSNDFTDELKEKLENLTGSDSLILHYECNSNGYNNEGSIRENIINNQKLINDFIADGGDPNKIIALFTFGIKTSDLSNKDPYPYPIGSAIGINFKQKVNVDKLNYLFEIISFKTVYYNPAHRTQRIARFGGFIGNFCIEYNGDRYVNAFTFNWQPREELVTLTTVNKLLGNITSYTNEEIEQLIAEGYDVKVFKLDIDEDKTLLQQILVDNPEDGSIDITQALYFVYDSAKDKYYDVNSLIIETVENDRQINIVGGLGKLDYTAIKIDTDNTEYIVNPSHVEGGNSDWDENDEDKASYVKNRTHWKETNRIYNHLQYSDTERRLSVAKFVEIFRLASNAAQLRITDKIDFWEYNDSDKQAISFVKTPNGIMFTICMKYPNINEGVITVSYDDTDALDDTILNILFDETGTKYDINNNLDKLYPGERTYNFEDKGFDDTIYHKIDKKYLPDDIGVEGITNEEIDELINE